MDERTVLLAQVRAVNEQLNRVEQLLAHADITGYFHRVTVEFTRLVKGQRDDIVRLERRLPNVAQLRDSWNELNDIRRATAPIVRECKAIVEGALARRAGLDGGMCIIADRLLRWLSHRADIPWQRFTILGDGECYEDMVQIVRLRFAESDIWSLPVAAHEFGHYAALELETRFAGRSRHPVQDFIEKEAGDKRQRQHLFEYFADMFAAYALGPAFGWSCVFQRFNPANAYRRSHSHPSDSERMHGILMVLSNLAAGADTACSPDRLRALWAASLRASNGPDRADRMDADNELQGQLEVIYQILDKQLPRLRYAGWGSAVRLRLALDSRAGDRPAVQATDSVADVLNAAWLARIEAGDPDPYRDRQIADTAEQLCLEIADRQQGS